MSFGYFDVLRDIYGDIREEYEKVNLQIEVLEGEKKQEAVLFSDKLFSRMGKLEEIFEKENVYNVKLFQIQEDERHRIARDLHDTSLQNITHIIHKLELCSLLMDGDPVRAKQELSILSTKLRLAIEEIRNTIFNLRPMEFDDLGLKASFERLISIVNKDNDYEVDFYVEDVSREDDFLLFTIYRSVQECLTNIVKHAEATKIIFHAKFINDKYVILIEDNGKGFILSDKSKKETNHFGMSLMRECVSILRGTVDVTSGANGTRVKIEIPKEELSEE